MSIEVEKLFYQLQDLVGFEIDQRYQLRSVLGEGGMGVVFRAHQKSVNRDIAVKVLKLDRFENEEDILRFKREVDIISSLTHPNIVRLLDSGRDGRLGVFFIAMELVEGLSLYQLLNGRRARVEFALEVVYQVCGALTEPHQRGVIHRDIKPDNLLLVASSDDSAVVRVVDFGIARALGATSKLTMEGMLVGTPMYMAPEVCLGEPVDLRTDLYSVGVMLYEMLAGKIPYDGDTPLSVAYKHVNAAVPRVGEQIELLQTYPEVDALTQALMAKNPADRPHDARNVRRRIEAIRDHYQLPRVRVDSALGVQNAFAPWFDPSTEAKSFKPQSWNAKSSMLMAGISQDREGRESASSPASAHNADKGQTDNHREQYSVSGSAITTAWTPSTSSRQVLKTGPLASDAPHSPYSLDAHDINTGRASTAGQNQPASPSEYAHAPASTTSTHKTLQHRHLLGILGAVALALMATGFLAWQLLRDPHALTTPPGQEPASISRSDADLNRLPSVSAGRKPSPIVQQPSVDSLLQPLPAQPSPQIREPSLSAPPQVHSAPSRPTAPEVTSEAPQLIREPQAQRKNRRPSTAPRPVPVDRDDKHQRKPKSTKKDEPLKRPPSSGPEPPRKLQRTTQDDPSATKEALQQPPPKTKPKAAPSDELERGLDWLKNVN